MWNLYILESQKNKRLYVGITDNLKRRIAEHNSGRGGEYTRKNCPFKLIFYEAYLEKNDAIRAEKFFKSGYGREVLRKNKLLSYFEKIK
jgi:putative endonuclease